jgi:AcrR family transcriptional regulator
MKEDRASHILQAATKRFLAVGYARCRVDSIASDARVSKRDIYDAWPNKAALFSAVVSAIYAAQDGGWDLTTAALSTRDALAALARRNIDLFLEDGSLGLLRASIELVRQHPGIAAQIHAGRTTSWAGFANYIAELVSQYPGWECASHMAGIRFGSLNVEGARHLMGAAPLSARDRQELAERTADIFLNGALHAGTPAERRPTAPAPYPAPQVEGKSAIRLSPDRFDALIDLALAEFCRTGFAGIKLADVARQAGISTATIYRHFPNKDALFRHAVQARIHRNSLAEPSADQSSAPAPDGDPEVALTALARALLDRHLRPENLALARLLIEEAVIVPDLSRAYYEQEVAVAACALSRLADSAGFAMPDDLATRAFHTLATFGTRFLILEEPVPEYERDSLSAQAAAIFLRGIAGSRPHAEKRPSWENAGEAAGE